MPTSIITVYNSSRGRVEPNARVLLEWSGFANLGQSNAVKTNNQGQAIINHSSTGRATIYINGSNCGSFSSPGSTTVEV